MERTSRKKINLHLGAHKTATTFIQKVLRGNKNILSGHGIRYIPMQSVRKNVTRNIRAHVNRGAGRAFTVRRISEFIAEKFPEECETLVLSDENLIGSCREIYLKSDIYPGAMKSLQLISEALQGYEVNVYFCVREYVKFLPSAYCEFLRHNNFITFEEFLGGLDPGREYWPRVINDIVGVFGSSNTHVWRYEDFRYGVDRIMADLVSTDDVTLSYDFADVRLSMSNMSMRALYKLNEVLSPADTRKLVKAVAVAFPKSEGYEEYSPWDNEQKTVWSNKYKNELDMIRHQEGVFMELR